MMMMVMTMMTVVNIVTVRIMVETVVMRVVWWWRW